MWRNRSARARPEGGVDGRNGARAQQLRMGVEQSTRGKTRGVFRGCSMYYFSPLLNVPRAESESGGWGGRTCSLSLLVLSACCSSLPLVFIRGTERRWCPRGSRLAPPRRVKIDLSEPFSARALCVCFFLSRFSLVWRRDALLGGEDMGVRREGRGGVVCALVGACVPYYCCSTHARV